jgi:hypothetical protein
MLQQIYQSFCGSDVSHDKHTLFAIEESGPPCRPIPASPSREPSPHRSVSLTDSPRHHHQKKEEDPHMHIDETKPHKAKA